MLLTILLILVVFWLAWANGGNDNYMGVATLYGSGTLSYRSALAWATVTTAAGCLVSVAIAGAIVTSFSGRGIVPVAIEGTAPLLLSVAGAAAATKFIATLLGMPTSTTHALTGGLVGVGWMAGSGTASLGVLGAAFLAPLALSPLLAIGVVGATYPILHRARVVLGIDSESCLCVAQASPRLALIESREQSSGDHRPATFPVLRTGTTQSCADRYTGHLGGVRVQSVVNVVHLISGGTVCFARSVNDTPKIAALLIVTGSSLSGWHLVFIAVAMTFGGLVHSRGIARTMGDRITEMNTGQAATANVITSALVLAASAFALPVSTTHVSCSSIFAIGFLRGAPHWRTINSILFTWIVTLPVAMILGALIYTGMTALAE